MKAIVFQHYGSPDYLVLKEVGKPVPKDNEVLISVHAASINEWDWAILHGTPFINRFSFGIFNPRKQILGADVAGSVVAVGKHVRRFRPGSPVFGDLCSCGWGGLAEYVCAYENALTLKPASISFEQAASLPQAGLLAVQGLRKGKLLHGQIDQKQTTHVQKILINGASGGAGTIAVQMAKSYGAEVTGVCSTCVPLLWRGTRQGESCDYCRA